jgi:Flp pilus assembly protein TadD
MIQNKNAFVLLTAGLLFLTGSLRADDATPASTTPAATYATTPVTASTNAAPATAPKKPSIKEAMKAAGDLAQAGKTDEAIAAYEAIGTLPSKKGESWRLNSEGLAYLEAATPEADKAVPVLEKAVATDAGNAVAWNNLGSAYEQTDQPKKAEDAYQKAMDASKAGSNSSDKAEANLKALQAKLGDAKPDSAAASTAADATPADSSTATPGADASK